MNILQIKNAVHILALMLLFWGLSQASVGQTAEKLQIKNNSSKILEDQIVEIPLEKLNLKIGDYHILQNGKTTSPIEIITDIWGNQQALILVPRIASKEDQTLKIAQGNLHSFPKRTSAELTHKIGGQFIGKEYIGGYSWVKTSGLTLPGSFTDHSYYIKYEGPGWESDKVAYRFYLDNRNAIDVFAKHTSDLVLAGVGVDGFDNYHKLASWGMDNLKVGKSLGLGTIATWDGEKAVRVEKKDSTNCVITADGKLRSQVRTTYYGWQANKEKCNLVSLISIDAGSCSSHIELLTDTPIDNIATGIIKQKEGKLIVRNNANEKWSYIATFGKQSMNKDIQGLVVFAQTKQVRQITEDELNHIVILNPSKNGYVDYYIMPTWELDKEPIRTEAEFLDCIEKELLKLNDNIEITNL